MKRLFSKQLWITALSMALLLCKSQAQQISAEIEEKVKSEYAQLSDNIKLKDYATALNHFTWLYQNETVVQQSKPAYLKNAYIYGIQIYDGLLPNEKDEAKKKEYQDKLIELHLKRIVRKFDGDNEVDLYQKLGKRYYTYLKDRPDFDKAKAFELYHTIFEKANKQIERPNLVYYMVLAKAVTVENYNLNVRLRNLQKDKAKAKEAEALEKSEEFQKYARYTTDWYLDRYDAISDLLDEIIASTAEAEKAEWTKTKQNIDGMFAIKGVIEPDCNFVKEKMAADIKAKPSDVRLQKRAFKYMLEGKCTDEPLFMTVVANLFNAGERTAGLASVMANKYLVINNLDSAIFWFDEAIKLSNDEPQKAADYILKQARILQKQGKKSAARAKAYDAIEKDPSQASEAYELIGDLYFTSGNECGGTDQVSSRAVYLAAYDMYVKAGNNKKAASASEHFPTLQDVFLLQEKGYSEGGSLSIGCWIGGSTIIRVKK
ncbi:MAG: hypothetical protein NZ521_00625 [Flammeovirgaceae bacterium]|nr:hypothetical protein [Flammeovirgaceae bacterium]MDW8286556.1 hypothetical protein [Flammeovirgaceae bacterium]